MSSMSLVLLVVIMLVAGCGTPKASGPHEQAVGPGVVVESSLDFITIVSYQERSNEGLLEMQAHIQNLSHSQRVVYYQVEWFDKQDFGLGRDPWHRFKLEAEENKVLRIVSRYPDASRARLHLIRKP